MGRAWGRGVTCWVHVGDAPTSRLPQVTVLPPGTVHAHVMYTDSTARRLPPPLGASAAASSPSDSISSLHTATRLHAHAISLLSHAGHMHETAERSHEHGSLCCLMP